MGPDRHAWRAELDGRQAPRRTEAADRLVLLGTGRIAPVLSHLVPGEGTHTPEEWEALVRPHFDGELICGVDLDELSIAADPA